MGTSFKVTSNHWMCGLGVFCGVTTMTVNMFNQLVINIFFVWESVNWMSHHLTFKSCLSCRENLLWPCCVITWYDSSWQESEFRSCCDRDCDWPYVPSMYNDLSAAIWNAAYFIVGIYFPNGCDWLCGGECCSVLRCKGTGPCLVYECLKTVISQWGWVFHSGGDTCGPVGWHHIVWWVVTVVSKGHTATIFSPWMWGQYFPTKCGFSPATLHDVMIQTTTVRTTSCTCICYLIHIQGVTGGTDQTSGGCSLC